MYVQARNTVENKDTNVPNTEAAESNNSTPKCGYEGLSFFDFDQLQGERYPHNTERGWARMGV